MGRLIFAAFLALLLPAYSASACTVPTPAEYDATRRPVDIVLEGVARTTGAESRIAYAEFDVSAVQYGSFPQQNYRLEWQIFQGGGECAPPGPHVRSGEKVRVYLRKSGNSSFRAAAWEYVDLYPKDRALVEMEQGVAQYREFRSEKYFSAGGALSFTDPDTWLPAGWISDEELSQLRKTPFSVHVQFTVDPWGGIAKCESSHADDFKFAYLDKRACEIISKNVTLVPPVFADETWGSFSWYVPRE